MQQLQKRVIGAVLKEALMYRAKRSDLRAQANVGAWQRRHVAGKILR